MVELLISLGFAVSEAVGCDDFVATPIQIETLLHKLAAHLKLTWVYDQPLPPEGVKGLSDKTDAPNSLVGLLSEEAATLYELVLRGDIKGLGQQITRLEQLDDPYQPFVDKLRQLAKQYRIKQIQTLLESYMK